MADNEDAQKPKVDDNDVSLTPTIRDSMQEESEPKLQSIQDFLSKNIPEPQVQKSEIQANEQQTVKQNPAEQRKELVSKRKTKQKATKRRTLRASLPAQDERLSFPAVEQAAKSIPSAQINTPPAQIEPAPVTQEPMSPSQQAITAEPVSAQSPVLFSELEDSSIKTQPIVETAKAPQSVPTDTMQSAIQGMSTSKRKLIERRKENSEKAAKLKEELASAQNDAPIEMLQEALNAELAKQEKLKQQIESANNDLRQIRQQEAEIRSRRAKTEADIAERKSQVVELRRVRRDPQATPEEKAAATEKIGELEDEMAGYRQVHADEGAELAKLNENVQEKLKTREDAQAQMSSSKASSRDFRAEVTERQSLQQKATQAQAKDVSLTQDVQDYEQKRKQRDLEAAQRTTPAQYMRQAAQQLPTDPKREAIAATRSLGQDATFLEKRAYRQASEELNSLVNSIKLAKESLADLEEGTEEYAEKQKEITGLEDKAIDQAKKRVEIERNIAAREAKERGPIGTGFNMAARGVSGAFSMMGSALSASSQGAIERYVTEEEKKSADIRLKAQEVSDLRNRYTDASALLATGAGSLFGAETPYAKEGGTSQSVKALGKDYVDATKAMPGIELTNQIAGQLATGTITAVKDAVIAGSTTGMGMGMGAIPAAGMAGAGSIATSVLSTGVNALGTIASSPQLLEQAGGAAFGKAATAKIESAANTLNKAADSIGGFISKGGGDGAQFAKGSQQVVSGISGIAANVPTAITRAAEQVKEQNRLLQTQVEAGQVGRIKERLDLAFQPKLQSYLETLPAQRQLNKSLGFQTRQEREQTQLNVEGLSIDEELTQMGFSPDQVIQATGAAASAYGRHGRGKKGFDLMQRSVKSAAMAENLGMGDATQSIAAMGRMMEGGVEDPQAAFKKAMQEALMLGLQDSRDFQGLLSAASETADNTVGFEGSLKLIASAAGTGRAGDLETAKSYAEMVKRQTSGATGTFHDIVKMQQTKESISGVLGTAEEQGLQLDEKARTQLLTLSRLRPEDLENREFAESAMGPQAMEAIKAFEDKTRKQTGNKDFDFFKDYAQKVNIRAGMTGAIEFTQDEELVKVRDMLLKGDKGGLQKMFGLQEGASAEEKKRGEEKRKQISAQLIGGTAGYYAGDEKAADIGIGAASAAVNQLEQILGQEVAPKGGILEKHRHRMSREKAEGAAKEAGLAGSTAEAQIGGAAGVSAEERKGVLGTIYKDGKQALYGTQAEEVSKFSKQEQDLISKVKTSDTVTPTEKLKPVDQEIAKIVQGLEAMSASLKNFSLKDAVVTVTGDVLIDAKKQVTAAILDNAITATTNEIGKNISNAISNAMPWNKSKEDKQKKDTVQVPGPMGGN